MNWSEARWAEGLRTFLQAVLLFPVVRWFCRPVKVEGIERLRDLGGPYLFVANHSSHADTAVLLQALPASLRRRTAPAAAQDYFFSNRIRSVAVRLVMGAFPFPRRGPQGLERAQALLARGRSVLLFPEGTRSRDGRVGEFRCGAGVLGATGVTVVPVGIAGASNVLPKGRHLPSRAAVGIAFGAPRTYSRATSARAVAADLRDHVTKLVSKADADRPASRRSLFERAGAMARSRRGLQVAFVWGMAEALLWPVVPDFLVALLALAAPSRALALAGAATVGSVAGGVLAFGLGLTDVGVAVAAHAPLVTDPMRVQAAQWLLDEGPRGLLHQPLSGIPYKVFGYAAGDGGVTLLGFVWYSTLARGARLVAVGAVFGGAGRVWRRAWPRLFGAFLVVYTVAFTVGLARISAEWR